MKKYLKIILVVIFYTSLLFSCKKDSAPKDYTASIKDKTWWGELAYTGKTIEYYSVHFNADNSLIWSQLSGDYSGHWALEGKAVTITFTGNSLEIKANISDDDKLVNITDNSSASEIKSGQLIITPNVYLDNTVWKGSIITTSQPFQMSFTSPLKVETKYEAAPFGPYTYSRSVSGAVIRFISAAAGGNVFDVIISNNEMRGSTDLSNSGWKLLKQ
jgi:hypothetical protein